MDLSRDGSTAGAGHSPAAATWDTHYDRADRPGSRRVTLYLDSSAFIKRYVLEENRDTVEALLLADPEWVTARHTLVEVVIALHQRLGERDWSIARETFDRDWDRTYVVELDERVCRRAAELGVATRLRTLDALHLAAADRAGGHSIPIVTFDVRLGVAARALGFNVIGA
jgi:predicted nucleic acid-binding protein